MSEKLIEALPAVMEQKWNEWTSDTGCFPDDFTWKGGKGVLYFSAGNWVSRIQAALRARFHGGTKAVNDILAERERQTGKLGWTPEHDDDHVKGELAAAAACYAVGAMLRVPMPAANIGPWSRSRKMLWPWAESDWRPSSARRNLVKAGALILAEIERLDRKEGCEA